MFEHLEETLAAALQKFADTLKSDVEKRLAAQEAALADLKAKVDAISKG